MNPSSLTKHEIMYRQKRGFYRLYLLLALVIAETTAILMTNTPRSTPVFLFLLILLVGLSLELGRLRALAAWLVMMFAWLLIKRWLGAWTTEMLAYNLLETALLLALAWTGGAYRDRQSQFWEAFAENAQRLNIMELEDPGIGLLRTSLGELRLEEEEERSFTHHRPLGLLLLHVQANFGTDREPREQLMVLKAIAATLKDAARDTDIPFLVETNRMGLILPETDLEGIDTVVGRLTTNLENLRYIQTNGESAPVRGLAQVRYGYVVYLGDSPDHPEMLLAARKSLERSIACNQGPVFQNLFIEYELLGSVPAQQTAVLPIPID